jgi:hypothetical protein
VYVHRTGSMLFVIEARPGPSNSIPGTNCGGTCLPTGSERGDVRMVVSADLGDGSTQICDMGPDVFGGVPGFNPPLLSDSSQMVTEAIQDLACRIVPRDSAALACTRDSFGNFSYLSCEGACGSTRQYCFQVPFTAAFPFGDTVVAMQIRDIAGNLGPPKEIVVRVVP